MTLHLADPANSVAVLVGVASYEDSRYFPPLPAVTANVTRLAELLTDPGVWGIPAERCHQLINPPDAGAIIDAVLDARTQAKDTVVLYLAGHGASYGDELLFPLPGTRYDRRSFHALAYSKVREALSVPGSRHAVVILDCCYSGAAHAMGDTESKLHAMLRQTPKSTYLLTSSSESSESLAPPGATHTLFTGHLIRMMEEGVAGLGEHLPFGELYDELCRELLGNGPLPVQSDKGIGSQIAIVRNRSFRADPQPLETSVPPVPSVVVTRVTSPAAEGVAHGVRIVADAVAEIFGPATPNGDVLSITAATHLPQAGSARGVSAMHELAHRMRAEHGDGAATAILLADAVLTEIGPRPDPGTVNGLRAAAAETAARLRDAADPVTPSGLLRVITTACGFAGVLPPAHGLTVADLRRVQVRTTSMVTEDKPRIGRGGAVTRWPVRVIWPWAFPADGLRLTEPHIQHLPSMTSEWARTGFDAVPRPAVVLCDHSDPQASASLRVKRVTGDLVVLTPASPDVAEELRALLAASAGEGVESAYIGTGTLTIAGLHLEHAPITEMLAEAKATLERLDESTHADQQRMAERADRLQQTGATLWLPSTLADGWLSRASTLLRTTLSVTAGSGVALAEVADLLTAGTPGSTALASALRRPAARLPQPARGALDSAEVLAAAVTGAVDAVCELVG